MNELPVVLEIKANFPIDQRVELILDLTRRLELLDELLSNARGGRGDSRGGMWVHSSVS